MMSKLNDDVEFALEEYNNALVLEAKAQQVWDRRKVLADYPPQNPTADENRLLQKPVEYFRKRFKDRMRTRIKKKEIFDKRTTAKDKHKQDMDVVERKENWVYSEGSNFNIRWSSLPG